jgi:L-ribulose-5-phosphate 4-epimerase
MAAPALEELRDAVCRANRAIAGAGLVTLSFGNVSGLDPESGLLVIKPSGVPCAELRPEQLVVVAVETGQVLGGGLRPSSDTPTHLALYRRYPEIGGVVHTHSTAAASWAQACRSIPPLGTTHADHFRAAVPVTRQLTEAEVAGDYELATGNVIVETLERLRLRASEMPAALVASHGPFTWGAGPAEAVDNAIALEAVAAMASRTLALAPNAADIRGDLLDRHFQRKHGPTAYYGQVHGAPEPGRRGGAS